MIRLNDKKIEIGKFPDGTILMKEVSDIFLTEKP